MFLSILKNNKKKSTKMYIDDVETHSKTDSTDI